MKPGYLLVVASQESDVSDHAAHLSRSIGLPLAQQRGRLILFADDPTLPLAVGDESLVVGTLFRKHAAAERVTALSAAEVDSVVKTAGQSLYAKFWGGWIAAIETNAGMRVLRDPSATWPCYYSRRAGAVAFASDAALLVGSGFAAVEVDWGGLARHLLGAGMPTNRTALRGVEELMAGFGLPVGTDTGHQRPCWCPWEHVEPSPERPLGAERLRRTVCHAVHACGADRGRLLLSVSGGLDSSIVAACLKQSRADVTCLTMYTEDPSGDERVYARALCQHLGLPLIEYAYRIEDIDLTQPLGPHLPRPTDRAQALAYEHTHLAAARQLGAAAFVTGSGGDSVFGYSQSAAPVADRLLSRSAAPETLGTLMDVSRQTGCSLLDASRQTLSILRAGRAYRPKPNPLLLDRDLVRGLGNKPFDHPWLQAPSNALPGKSAHIASILRIQQSFESTRGQFLPDLNPLMSQPIIEACLAVPSWEWRRGGRDRSLAREAFADDLPPLVLERRRKGGPGHFAGQILDHFRGQVRELVLGGRLAERRIVDKPALEQCLAQTQPIADEERVRILELAATESWLESWLSRRTVQKADPLNAPSPSAPEARPNV